MAELLKQVKLIVWDEAPMAHKSNIEALNTALQDVRENEKPFGGVNNIQLILGNRCIWWGFQADSSGCSQRQS